MKQARRELRGIAFGRPLAVKTGACQTRDLHQARISKATSPPYPTQQGTGEAASAEIANTHSAREVFHFLGVHQKTFFDDFFNS